MLPLQTTLDQAAMAMKGYSTFTKPPALLEPHYQIVYCHIQDTRWWGSYRYAEKQSVYSTPPSWLGNRANDVGGLTPLWRSSRCILCSSQLSNRTYVGGDITPLMRSSRCILQFWATGHTLVVGGGLTPPQRSSRCIRQLLAPPATVLASKLLTYNSYDIWIKSIWN